MSKHDSEVQKVLDRLREVGSKISDLPWVYPLQEPLFGDGVSQADIASLESVIKSPLPDDFLLFQKLCGSISAMDIWNGYSLMEASHIRALIIDTRSPQVIQVADGKSTLMPVGGDGGGNMFLMSFIGSSRVSKWNHEVNTQEKLADSFTGFLERMLEDWEHFAAQDAEWKYLAG